MAGTPKVYGRYVPQLGGNTIAEASECSWGNENTDQDVVTMILGFDGQTPGEDKMVISASIFCANNASLLPTLQGYELDKSIVDFAIQEYPNGKKMSSKGFIRNVKGSSSVGSNSPISFEFHGTPSKFE